MVSPGPIRRGSIRPALGPSRWTRARPDTTTTAGRSSKDASRCSTRSRRPMVSTFGLMRSKGSVSQAGNSSTDWPPRYRRMSLARRSASVPVGTATTSGVRPARRTREARTTARAGSATANEPVRRPRTAATDGASSRSSGRRSSSVDVTLLVGPAVESRAGVDTTHGGLHTIGDDRLHRVGGLLDHHP